MNPTNEPLLKHYIVRHSSPAAAGPLQPPSALIFPPGAALCAGVLYCAVQAASLPAGILQATLDKTSAGQKAGGF